MAKRFWTCLLVAIAVCAAIALGVARSRGPQLLSEHAQPVVTAPSEIVAVSADGNLFHVPGCRYLHGKVETMPASEAIVRGYAPCTRCMRKTLAKAGGL